MPYLLSIQGVILLLEEAFPQAAVYFSRGQDHAIAAVLYIRTPGKVEAEATLTLYAMKVTLVHDNTLSVECSRRERRGSEWVETPLDTRTLRSEMDLVGWLGQVQTHTLTPNGQNYIEPWRVHTGGSKVELPNLVESCWRAAEKQLPPPLVPSFTHADLNGVGLDWHVSGGTPVKVKVQFLRPGDLDNPIAIVQGLPNPDAHLNDLVRAIERKGACHPYALDEPTERDVDLDMLDNELLAATEWLGGREAIAHIQVSPVDTAGLQVRSGFSSEIPDWMTAITLPSGAFIFGTFSEVPVYAVAGTPGTARLVFDLALRAT